jgi:hypothetical protein
VVSRESENDPRKFVNRLSLQLGGVRLFKVVNNINWSTTMPPPIPQRDASIDGIETTGMNTEWFMDLINISPSPHIYTLQTSKFGFFPVFFTPSAIINL